jgi:hypothetical protein
MTRMHNRRGSVLLMAIGMLTILAILTSTFLVISNLDSEETDSLQVRAYADPILDGLLAKAVAAISFDRQTTAAGGPYALMAADSTGLVSFMDYPHAYPASNKETDDHWLSSSYVPGEGIYGQITNLVGPDSGSFKVADCALGTTPKFTETATSTYLNGYDKTGTYVDTDGDGIPDAVLYDTGISSPLSDANTYYAAVRIEDLGARMCVNTAGGWDTSESQYDRPIGCGPEMIDLRTFLDKRSGTSSTTALYPLLHAGDTAGSKGRVGDASPATGGTAANPAPASTKGYYRWCGAYILSPGKPATGTGGYQPFGIGDEVFFINACNYIDNMSQFGGRINQMILPLCNATTTPLPDGIRRQLTTINCVSSLARWPNTTLPPYFTEPLVINSVQSIDDCKLVYERMKLMLEATGMGKDENSRARMAAHFAANLWAYNANGTGTAIGEPWKFTPTGQSFSVYGVRTNMVITQVFARHVKNTLFDANDPSKDNSAWGYAIEVANPTSGFLSSSSYELEVRPDGGSPATTAVFSGLFSGVTSSSVTPPKKVVYFYGAGPSVTATKDTFFGASTAGWFSSTNNALDFRAGKSTISVTLYYKIGSERVPLDYVSVGANGCDLTYDTNVKEVEIRGDYVKKTGPTAADTCIHIRRDDRLLITSPSLQRVARLNMAMYTESTSFTGTTLGSANGVTETQLTRRSYYGMPADNHPAFVRPKFSPALYRPRDTAVTTSPTARDSWPADNYFLPSLADLSNVYLAGPISDGTDRPFTTEILREDMSNAFKNRADIGRLPSVKAIEPLVPADFVDFAPTLKYPDIPPAYMFHEFFTRTIAHQARPNEKKRIYGMPNINTLPIPSNITAATGVNCAIWWLPWPQENSSTNRLGLGQTAKVYVRSEALKAIRQYRDLADDCANRATWTGIPTLRSANGSNIGGFLTPGEVGIPLAKYMDTLLQTAGTPEQDTDYVRTRNCLFSYISDCISTRSDVYACYITVQHGRNYSGKRWRYVAVIDRSNVVTPTDKAAVLLVSQLR